MKQFLRTFPPYFLSGFAAVLTAADVFLSFHPHFVLSPLTHLLFFGLAALCVFMAARIHSARLCGDAQKEKVMRAAWQIITVLFLWLVLCLTLFDRYFGRTGFQALLSLSPAEYLHALSRSVNWIPFSTIAEYARYLSRGEMVYTSVVNLFGNIAAFAPLGLLYPLCSTRLRRFIPFTAGAVLTVAAVELAQLLLVSGTCDIDDLILNTVGMWLVFFCFRIPPIRHFTGRISGVSF